MAKEDPKRVAARVKRYRESTPTERLEIVGVTPELKELFRQLPGLEDLKAAERLHALIEHWQRHHQVKPPATKALPSRRRQIEEWFKTRHDIILPRELAKSRAWQRFLRDDPELRQAMRTLDKHVHPDLSHAVKHHQLTIVPTQLKAIAALEPEFMIELIHLAISTGLDDRAERIDGRLRELHRQAST